MATGASQPVLGNTEGTLIPYDEILYTREKLKAASESYDELIQNLVDSHVGSTVAVQVALLNGEVSQTTIEVPPSNKRGRIIVDFKTRQEVQRELSNNTSINSIILISPRCTLLQILPPKRLRDFDLEDAMSDKEAQEHIELEITKWEKSKHFVETRGLLVDLAKRHRITKVAGFALGGIPVIESYVDNSLIQHRLLRALRNIVEEQLGSSVEVFSQDPAYDDFESKMLEDWDIRVSTHPIRGFLEINHETAVVSINPDIPVKQIITDITKPALIIWSQTGLNRNPDPDPETQKSVDLLETEYDEYKLPDHMALKKMCVYIRKLIE